ncbi:hypothetical protein HGRIS_002673 [Hohenbuehelia grisea]|uniref:histone deacetylase n=1 Tax=Hohenbuehelia grisea TaxID=104357 RepID=A0ABR3JLC4_9AGAR
MQTGRPDAHDPDAMDVDMEEPRPSLPVLPKLPAVTSQTMRASSLPRTPGPSVGYVYSAEMSQHFSPSGHPERPERISRIWSAIVAEELHTRMRCLPIRPVQRDEALLVHTDDHWEKVQTIQHLTPEQIADSEEYYEQLSLYVMPGTTRAARLSCGGVIEACMAVAEGSIKKSLAIVRPPGHHAEPDEHMGFCFFNNVAVAARVVQQRTKVKKILILDWDVHHGNGTQRAFNDDPSILYISLHRYENGRFYPSSTFGGMESCGEGAGLGYSVNIPWPEAGMGDADYLLAFQHVVMPIAMEFAPELVIISAGFDAAAGDELGECLVTPDGYAHMTYMLSGLASGKLVVALEGGYNLDSISNSALAVTKVVLGDAPPEIPQMVAKESATETIFLVAQHQSKYWKTLNPKALEPKEDIENITFGIPEILKAHRQYYLYTTHQMMQIPLGSPELEERFGAQVVCSGDIFERKTLVLFVHEMGNIRAELDASVWCDVRQEKSYLIDASKEVIAWVKSEGYSIIDVNLNPKPFTSYMGRPNPRPFRPTDVLGREVITYIWDNFVQLSDAKQVILIGHGPGCQPVMDLIDNRAAQVMKLVKSVVQIVGEYKVPAVPKYSDDVRAWYGKVRGNEYAGQNLRLTRVSIS